MKKDEEKLCVKRFYLAREIAILSLLVPPRHSLLRKWGENHRFYPYFLEKCQKNDRKLIEKGRKLTPALRLQYARKCGIILLTSKVIKESL